MHKVQLGDAHYDDQPFIKKPRLLWTDPPYGTGKIQAQSGHAYKDFADTGYVISAILSWLPIMDSEGTVVVCCDYRLAPTLTEAIEESGWKYRGEVIWEFGLGRPRTSWWPVRHNNLLTFTASENSGLFNKDAVPRTKRLAPKPGYEGDKPMGSVWDFTMSNTNSQRVGYPNQKPLEIIKPFIQAHTMPGDLVLDIFCGSSSTGQAALELGRNYYGIDSNPEAVAVSEQRLSNIKL